MKNIAHWAVCVFVALVLVIWIGWNAQESMAKRLERDCLLGHEVTLNGTTFHCEVKEEQ